MDGDEEYAIECPECHTHYVPLEPLGTGSLDLPKGTMFGVRCPECGHGVYMQQLNEPVEPVDDDA